MDDEMGKEGSEQVVLTDNEQKIHDIEVRHKAELAGLNRKVTELTDSLTLKSRSSDTVEERINALEADRDSAVRRAESVEAFGKAGLKDEWRQLFTVKSPDDQAGMLNTMLETYKSNVMQEMAGEFKRSPDDMNADGARSFSMDQLKGKSTKEINALWAQGRIKGSA